jgi:hypothetical protein
MSRPADSLQEARTLIAEARLVALFRSGRRKDAFEAAVRDHPTLAAAFLTEAAEELRHSLNPARGWTRARLLEQAAETLGRIDPPPPDRGEAVAWLRARATEARAQAKGLWFAYGFVGLLALVGIALAFRPAA